MQRKPSPLPVPSIEEENATAELHAVTQQFMQSTKNIFDNLEFEINLLLGESQVAPLQPQSPFTTILPFTAEQITALEIAASKYSFTSEVFMCDLRFLALFKFSQEEIIEIVSHGKVLVDTLRDTLNELNQLQLNKDHIFIMIKARKAIALQFVKIHFLALKNLNLTPDQLVELILEDPNPCNRKAISKETNVSLDSLVDFDVAKVKSFMTTMNFTKATLEVFVANLKKAANLDSFKRNCQPLMTLGFSAKHLRDIVCASNIRTTGVILDVLRDITPELKILGFTVEQITVFAMDAESLEIFYALKRSLNEINSLGLQPLQIIELLNLPDKTLNIDAIKMNYLSLFSVFAVGGTAAVMNVIKAGASTPLSIIEEGELKRRRTGGID